MGRKLQRMKGIAANQGVNVVNQDGPGTVGRGRTHINLMLVNTAVVSATNTDRRAIEALLTTEKLPTEDLPASLERFWIVREKDRIIGVIGLELHRPYGLLRSLAVLSDHRGLGIGNTLVRTVEEQAARLGLDSIYLLTETAKSYFEKRGYIIEERNNTPDVIRRSSEFSHVCPVSAAVMKKTINK